jgi:hypothetical protein
MFPVEVLATIIASSTFQELLQEGNGLLSTILVNL